MSRNSRRKAPNVKVANRKIKNHDEFELTKQWICGKQLTNWLSRRTCSMSWRLERKNEQLRWKKFQKFSVGQYPNTKYFHLNFNQTLQVRISQQSHHLRPCAFICKLTIKIWSKPGGFCRLLRYLDAMTGSTITIVSRPKEKIIWIILHKQLNAAQPRILND